MATGLHFLIFHFALLFRPRRLAWLGQGPFEPSAGVQIPSGTPTLSLSKRCWVTVLCYHCGDLKGAAEPFYRGATLRSADILRGGGWPIGAEDFLTRR